MDQSGLSQSGGQHTGREAEVCPEMRAEGSGKRVVWRGRQGPGGQAPVRPGALVGRPLGALGWGVGGHRHSPRSPGGVLHGLFQQLHPPAARQTGGCKDKSWRTHGAPGHPRGPGALLRAAPAALRASVSVPFHDNSSPTPDRWTP